MVICLERGADLHMAQLMPLPLTVSCSSKIQIGFTFLVPAYLGSPGKRAVKRVCVCVCVRACVRARARVCVTDVQTQTFYPHDAMLAQVLAIPYFPLSVSGSVTGQCYIEMDGRIKLVFCRVGFFRPVLHCILRKFGYLQK